MHLKGHPPNVEGIFVMSRFLLVYKDDEILRVNQEFAFYTHM